MKAVLYAFLATLCYSAEIVIADNKLSKVHPLLLTFYVGTGISIGAALMLLAQGITIELPSKDVTWWILIVLAISFIADWSHFTSLHLGVGAVVLCISYSLMPVVATAIKGDLPSLRLIASWVLAAMALLLAYKEVAK